MIRPGRTPGDRAGLLASWEQHLEEGRAMVGRLGLARLATVGAALVGLTVAGGVAALAQDATPVPGGPGLPPPPAGCAPIAEGLLAPRFIAIAEDGTVYVTESGIGGDEV